ncbi:hypothetical protein BD626DRAFT_496409 [Schizophyllum amplum]|uniref:MYND-type domain-containing protein n=1 Tax=Schizophyllum amplum TaxID=97359 RepID=A0A550CDB6_9AGAR|nr:hypothetical protein BD626DRAFT_496409 [Auriculariopsis ampla]
MADMAKCREAIARHTARLLWTDHHFQLATTVARLPGLVEHMRPPRRFFRVILKGAADLCLLTPGIDRDDNNAVRIISAEAAAEFLSLLLVTPHTRNIVCALETGLLEFMVDLDAVCPSHRVVPELEDHLTRSLVLPIVLRAFRRRFDAMQGNKRMSSYTQERFRDMLHVFSDQWRAYSEAMENKAWKRAISCSNANAKNHDSTMRPCPCGEEFYCSARCQRDHWRAVHRGECCREDGVWGLDGELP